MIKTRYKTRDIHEQIVLALVLMLLVVCSINVQFYLEQQITSNTVTYVNKLGQQKSLFDMSIEELMKVTITS
jgi:hypothetical protein